MLTLVSDATCLLGESPVWSSHNNSIYFVDIKNRAINRFCIESRLLFTIPTPSEVGCIVLKKNGGLVAAMQSGLAAVNFDTQEFLIFSRIDDDIQGNRPNDGKCDAAGRLWIASMDNCESIPSGRIWRISSPTSLKVMDSNFVIGNGIDWSPDSKKMYFTDSVNRIIYVYDYSLKDGTLKNKDVFAKISESDGFPDGLTVDSEGYVWSAHWDGWCITRYTQDGRVDEVIEMPVPRPTSLAFGGKNLTSLFITTASFGLLPEELRRAPLSGGLFMYETATPGRHPNHYSGD